MTIQDLWSERRYGALFILARYFYRVGEPIMNDAVYNRLEELIKTQKYDDFKEYLERTYDDDPVPTELLNNLGIQPVHPVLRDDRKELYEYLNEDKSFSIFSVTTYEEAWDFFREMKRNQLDVVASLKVDGVNTKMLYVDDEFALSLSRGRDGDSFDYTDNSAKILPARFETGKKITRLVGESFVVDEGLPILREKYNKPDGYVTGKSSAISLLRVKHELVDYQYLRTRLFYAEGVDDTLTGTFEKLEKAGFDVVPHLAISWKDIPDDFEVFKAWLKVTVFDSLWELGADIPSDGVVIEVNDLNWVGTQHNQYVNRQLALKFEQWSYKLYKGVIKNIIIEQKRVNKSVRIEIEPLVTSDGNNARIINSYNPSILIRNDLYEGKVVYFERNSNAFNCVIYGDKLQRLLGDEADEVSVE